MITPSDLIETLRKMGVGLTPRRLTDWRSKHLLPPLAERGAGRARGKVYGWNESEIVEQAIVLEDLLAEKSRSRYAALHLWRMGFSVPIELVKEGWLFQLRQHQAAIDARASSYADPSDLFGEMATFKDELPESKLDKSDATSLIAKALELVFSRMSTPVDEDDARIALLFVEGHVEGLQPRLTGRELRDRANQIAHFVRSVISRPLLLKAVEEVSADHLQVISGVLIELRVYFSSVVRIGRYNGIEACLKWNRTVDLVGGILADVLVRIEDLDDLRSAATFLTSFLRFARVAQDDLNASEKNKRLADFCSQTIEERRRIAALLKRLGYPGWGGEIGNT